MQNYSNCALQQTAADHEVVKSTYIPCQMAGMKARPLVTSNDYKPTRSYQIVPKTSPGNCMTIHMHTESHSRTELGCVHFEQHAGTPSVNHLMLLTH
jgi:hypothetical protein